MLHTTFFVALRVLRLLTHLMGHYLYSLHARPIFSLMKSHHQHPPLHIFVRGWSSHLLALFTKSVVSMCMCIYESCHLGLLWGSSGWPLKLQIYWKDLTNGNPSLWCIYAEKGCSCWTFMGRNTGQAWRLYISFPEKASEDEKRIEQRKI